MKIDVSAALDLDDLAHDLMYEVMPAKTLANFALDILSENPEARKKVHKALYKEFVVEPAIEKKMIKGDKQ